MESNESTDDPDSSSSSSSGLLATNICLGDCTINTNPTNCTRYTSCTKTRGLQSINDHSQFSFVETKHQPLSASPTSSHVAPASPSSTSASYPCSAFRLIPLNGKTRQVAFLYSYGAFTAIPQPSMKMSPNTFIKSEMNLLENTTFGRKNSIVLALVNRVFPQNKASGARLEPHSKHSHQTNTKSMTHSDAAHVSDPNTRESILETHETLENFRIYGTCVLYKRYMHTKSPKGSFMHPHRRNMVFSTWKSPSLIESYHLCDFVVAPDMRGKGLGTLMFQLLQEYLYKEGIPLMTLCSCIGPSFYTARGCMAVSNWEFQYTLTDSPRNFEGSLLAHPNHSASYLKQVDVIIHQTLKHVQFEKITRENVSRLICLVNSSNVSQPFRHHHNTATSLTLNIDSSLIDFLYARRDIGLFGAFDAVHVPETIGLMFHFPSISEPLYILWKYECFNENKLHVLSMSSVLLTPPFEKLLQCLMRLLVKMAKFLSLDAVQVWIPSSAHSPLSGGQYLVNSFQKLGFQKLDPSMAYLPLYYVPSNSPLADGALSWDNIELLHFL